MQSSAQRWNVSGSEVTKLDYLNEEKFDRSELSEPKTLRYTAGEKDFPWPVDNNARSVPWRNAKYLPAAIDGSWPNTWYGIMRKRVSWRHFNSFIALTDNVPRVDGNVQRDRKSRPINILLRFIQYNDSPSFFLYLIEYYALEHSVILKIVSNKQRKYTVLY